MVRGAGAAGFREERKAENVAPPPSSTTAAAAAAPTVQVRPRPREGSAMTRATVWSTAAARVAICARIAERMNTVRLA